MKIASKIILRPSIRILRIEKSYRGIFGILLISDMAFCVTLELPDLGNLRDISSIPVGQYLCTKVESPRFGETFEILNVPDRSHILFHAGNVLGDTKGCILLAQHFGKLYGDRAILNSGRTFKKFINNLKDTNQLSLTIKEVY